MVHFRLLYNIHFTIIQSFSVKANVPTDWPQSHRSSLGSRPSPFDVAALFVHQRQRSARSHSTSCHLLNPSLWLGSRRIVCILHQEVRNMRPRSHLLSLDTGLIVHSAEIRWLLTCIEIQSGFPVTPLLQHFQHVIINISGYFHPAGTINVFKTGLSHILRIFVEGGSFFTLSFNLSSTRVSMSRICDTLWHFN